MCWSPASERWTAARRRITGGDTAEVDIKEAGPGDVLLLYPRRRFDAGTPESHLPDLWQGYDEYRDRLLTFFSHVRLGQGFRFFLDPLTDRIGLNGEVQNLDPDHRRLPPGLSGLAGPDDTAATWTC